MSSVSLTQAVSSGDADAVSALLANGADVNERTGGGQTPLILATIFNHTHLVPVLLDAGADPQLRDNLGLNAIDWAQRRGANELIAVLTSKTRRTPKTETRAVPTPKEPASSAPDVNQPRPMSAEEKSQRWLAGLKQRISELPLQEPSDRPNIFNTQPAPPPTPEPNHEEIPKSEPAPPPEPPPERELVRKRAIVPEPELVSAPSAESVAVKPEPRITPVLPIAAEIKPRSKRKRCPRCNAVYNSDLVAYCAHHFVPLVDADEPPIISEPKASPVLFWMIIVITLTGSLVVGSLLTAYFYNSNKASPQARASGPSAGPVQKGTPVAGHELEGKILSLPAAECPLNGQEAIPGTVVVRVTIGKTGRVTSARASGGDWLLRGAATEAALKATFSPEKLRGRETEGTITYTFEP